MAEFHTTISYQAKMEQTYKKRIHALLKLLPPYCRNYQRYLKTRCTLHTCMQYLSDLYSFYRYLSESNSMINIIGIRSVDLSSLELLSDDDFTAYQTWLCSYRPDSEDPAETEKTSAAATQKRKFISLRIFFHYLYEKGKLTKNPMDSLTVPRIEKGTKAMAFIPSQSDLSLFFYEFKKAYKAAQFRLQTASERDLENMPSIQMRPAIILRDQVIAHMIADMGLRVSEVCSLNCADIDWERKRIHLPSPTVTHSENNPGTPYRYFQENVLALLKIYFNDARPLFFPNPANYDALFLGNKRSRITPRSIERMIKEYSCLAFGREHAITPRELRCTFSS